MASFGSATIVLDGPDGGIRFDMQGNRATLGRKTENDIVVPDVAASSFHAEMVVEGSGLIIRDLNSSNGTYVNGKRVQSSPLFDGDVIRIGQSQGRVTVLQPNGKPLRGQGDSRPVAVVAVVVVLLLAVGGALVVSYNARKNREHAVFMEYEQKAQALLKTNPCRVVSKAHVEQLHKLDDDLKQVQPGSGRRGKLTSADRAKNASVLAASRQRVAATADILKRLADVASAQKSAVDELKKFDDRFQDSDLKNAGRTLARVFAQQASTAEDFQHKWQDYSTYITGYNGLVEAFVASPDKAGADRLDAESVKPHDPAKFVQECEETFSQTSKEGMSKLAGIAQ